jgi:hypothetical protein
MYYTSPSKDKFDLDVLEIVGLYRQFGESTCFIMNLLFLKLHMLEDVVLSIISHLSFCSAPIELMIMADLGIIILDVLILSLQNHQSSFQSPSPSPSFKLFSSSHYLTASTIKSHELERLR